MNDDNKEFELRISNMLAATGAKYETASLGLDEDSIDFEITKDGSNRTLHVTPVDDSMIDLILFDSHGNTLAHGALFSRAVADLTPERLANIIADCF